MWKVIIAGMLSSIIATFVLVNLFCYPPIGDIGKECVVIEQIKD